MHFLFFLQSRSTTQYTSQRQSMGFPSAMIKRHPRARRTLLDLVLTLFVPNVEKYSGRPQIPYGLS